MLEGMSLRFIFSLLLRLVGCSFPEQKFVMYPWFIKCTLLASKCTALQGVQICDTVLDKPSIRMSWFRVLLALPVVLMFSVPFLQVCMPRQNVRRLHKPIRQGQIRSNGDSPVSPSSTLQVARVLDNDLCTLKKRWLSAGLLLNKLIPTLIPKPAHGTFRRS